MADHDAVELNRIKRLKTARACDQCRRVRSRCDIANPQAANYDESICDRCRRLSLECTFILPIGETRGKRIPTKATNPDQNSPSDSVTTEGSASSTLEAYSDPIERFKTFISTHLPIISPRDLTADSSILLHCSARLLATLAVDAASETVIERLKASLDAYMLTKTPFKTPTVQNVQALLLLSLLVEDPGYGIKFMTSVRMACSLGWNLQPQASDSSSENAADTQYIPYLWWTLVSTDIWLYLYSGLPLIINYRDFNTPLPPSPPFFAALVSLSEILRCTIRPHSLPAPSTPASTRLSNWARLHLPPPSVAGGGAGTITAGSVLRILHGGVVAVVVLAGEEEAGGGEEVEGWLEGALREAWVWRGVCEKVGLLGRVVRVVGVGLLRLRRGREGGLGEWGAGVGERVVGGLRRLAEEEGWGVVWRVGEEG